MSIFIPQNIGKPLTKELREQLLVEMKELEDKQAAVIKSWNDQGLPCSFKEYLLKGENYSSELMCYEHDIYFMKRTLISGIIQMGEDLDDAKYAASL